MPGWLQRYEAGHTDKLISLFFLYCNCFQRFLSLYSSDAAKGEGLQILWCLLIWYAAFRDSNPTSTIPWRASSLGTFDDNGWQGD